MKKLSSDRPKCARHIRFRDTTLFRSRVGTIAGCMVTDGAVRRDCSVRLIRDGIVIYTGKLGSLRRFENDVKEVTSGYECGMTIENFNDIKIDDIIEAFEDQEVVE